MSLARTVIILVLLSPFACPPPCAAACPALAALPESGAEYARRGDALSKQGKLPAAAERYWDAYCKDREFRYLVFVCAMHLKSGDLGHAREIVAFGRRRLKDQGPESRQYFQRCVAEVDRRATPGARKGAPPKPRSAWVSLESSPAGASVYLDSKANGLLCVTGVDCRRSVQLGNHTLILELPGHRPHQEHVVVDGDRSLAVELLPVPGTLRMATPATDSSGIGAEIFVDGKQRGAIGAGGPLDVELLPGKYLIEARRPGHQVQSEQVEVQAGAVHKVWIKLTPDPQPPRLGSLLVTADPSGQVFVDGHIKGVTPLRLELAEGSYLIEVRRDGLKPWTQVVQVKAGAQSLAEAKAPPVGTLFVVAETSAQVFIDGHPRGLAPLLVELPAGEYRIEVQRGGADPWRQRVRVEAQRLERIDVDPTRPPPPPPPPPPAEGSIEFIGEPGVRVHIDGIYLGAIPLDPQFRLRKAVPPGRHAIDVHRDGAPPWGTHVEVVAGQVSTVQVPPPPPPAGASSGEPAKPPAEASSGEPAKPPAGASSGEPAKPNKGPGGEKPGKSDEGLGGKEAPAEGARGRAPAKEGRRTSKVLIRAPEDATVYVDGVPIGKGDQMMDLGPGPHRIEVRRGAVLLSRRSIQVRPNEDVRVDLRAPDAAPPRRGDADAPLDLVFPRSAEAIGKGRVALELGAGFPYYLLPRATLGIHKKGHVGLDLSLEARGIFATSTRFATRIDLVLGLLRLQVMNSRRVALGLHGYAGIGISVPADTSYFFEGGPMLTVKAWRFRFTLWPHVQAYWDKLCPLGSELPGCGMMGWAGHIQGVRVNLQGHVEVSVHRRVNLWFALGGSNPALTWEASPRPRQRNRFTEDFGGYPPFSATEVPVCAAGGLAFKL